MINDVCLTLILWLWSVMWMASLEQSKAAKTACMACCFMINRMSARSSWVSSATAYDTLLLSTQTWKGQHRLAEKVSHIHYCAMQPRSNKDMDAASQYCWYWQMWSTFPVWLPAIFCTNWRASFFSLDTGSIS